MNKILFLLFLSSSILYSQESITNQLDSISNTVEAEEFLSGLNSKKNKFITFNEEKHKTALATKLFSKSSGGKMTIESDSEKVHYKIVQTTLIPHYRVSYIYLDGKKMSQSEINSLRRSIISQHKKGVPFQFLAEKYSMDTNAKRGGDLGWFTTGELHPVFEDKIVNGSYNINDTFILDIEDKDWHYVVLKTFEPRNIKEIKVLKIVEQKS